MKKLREQDATKLQAYIKEVLNYDETTGVFTWKKWRGNTAKPGSIAGTIDSKGHRQIRVNGVLYLAHRLAWLYVTGNWPCGEIDHINRDRRDNRISNLRDCSHQENSYNRGVYSSNKSGTSGVSWYPKYGKWVAHIRHDGKVKNLGYYSNKEDAIKMRMEAEETLYGRFSPNYKSG